MNPLRFFGFCALFLFSLGSLPGSEALPNAGVVRPQGVVVVANQRSEASLELARYYLEMRGIPAENLILLDCPVDETISWNRFQATIEDPLFQALQTRGWLQAESPDTLQNGEGGESIVWRSTLDFLVLCQGLPLRIAHDPERLDAPPATPKPFQTTRAAVDSELAMLPRRDSQIAGLIRNPFFNAYQPGAVQSGQVIRVCRLDGPTLDAAKGLIDRALSAEANGLRGRAYVDGGGPHSHGDRWLEETASMLEKLGFPTERKPSKKRFQAGDRFDAPALYFGWYTGVMDGPFKNPGFQFPPGAIGYHIHSFSASTLRSKTTRWTGPLIDRGITATVGNVFEPYLEFTHRPQMIVGSLQAGFTWGEAAYFALPALSWQTITIGDPLYRPFQINLEKQLEKGPALLDPLQQYAMIRLSRLLRAEEREAEALALAKRWFQDQPGVPLALEILDLMEVTGEDSDQVFILQVLSGVRSYRVFEYGLALKVASQMVAEGEGDQALELYTYLLAAPNLPVNIELAVLREGRKVARQLGQTLQLVEWGNRISQLQTP